MDFLIELIHPMEGPACHGVHVGDVIALVGEILAWGLLNMMQKEEIMDLVAYVLSGGDRKHEAFRK